MNVVLLFAEQRAPDGTWVLGERYATHARKIWKSRVGDVVRAAVAGGNRGHARIVSLDRRELRLEVVDLDDPPPPALGIALALALPRPPMLRRCLQQATALGVKRIHLFDCVRVERSFWSSRQIDAPAIREQLVLGLEQASDTVLPEVVVHRRFRAFRESVVGPGAVVADPSGEPGGPIGAAAVRVAVIGPEGGFLPEEIDACREQGARIVSLGPRLLRVETACVTLLARASEGSPV